MDDQDEIPDLIESSNPESQKTSHGLMKKVPITIVTEFGPTTDIEKSLTISQSGGSVQSTEWIPLANGCICCSVKDSGVAALEALVDRQSTLGQAEQIDYILLETTGIADPGNIAPMFWMDEGLGSSIYLDGIVTVVDAKNILKSLTEPTQEEVPNEIDHPQPNLDDKDNSHHGPVLTTAHLQISHADVIILNKSDLVSPSALESTTAHLHSINALAKIIPTTQSRVPSLTGTLLDLNAYSTFPNDPFSSTSTTTTSNPLTKPSNIPSHNPPSIPPQFSSHGHTHHDPTLSTLVLPMPPFDPQKLYMLENWLQSVLWEDTSNTPREYEVHRTKGLIYVTDGTRRVIQGVREIFDIIEISSSNDDGSEESREGKIVFIGRYLDQIPGLG